MKKLRIGIIGTGGIAHAHMRAYEKMDDIEIVAGADIVPGKARKFLDEFHLDNAKDFETADEMLSTMNLDAVSVCTYNSTHAECAIKALEAGCHVLLEKPMTVHLDEALEIMKAEKKSGKIVTIGFQPRYDSRMKKVKEIVQSGVLGKIYYIQTGGGRRRGIPGSTFIEKDLAGVGALADIGCYALDMVLNSIGYPKPLTVSATAYDYFGKNEKYTPPEDAKRFSVDDFSAAFIRLEGGITLDFRMSWAMHMNTTGATIILGTDAGLRIEPANPESLWGGAWDGSCGDVTLFHDEFSVPTCTPIPMTDQGEDRFFLKVRSFVDAILENKPAPIPTSQIIYNQAIIDGIIRSSESGHEVDIVIPEI
ncbi:MAG TPA: Gfo/Idh/MocA family oxidoreductase [Candidatus Gallacutalibacter stercoravium]|nr:Gfo/Idh/MocA family oxidoreductase [Candidatus Gallacutalibacter stercoravium]